MTESTVEAHLVREAAKRGDVCIKIRFIVGFPDRVLFQHGGRVKIVELKRPKGGVFEPLQERWHDRLRKMGFMVFVCRTKEEVDRCLDA